VRVPEDVAGGKATLKVELKGRSGLAASAELQVTIK
jgi:hypothetical protein